MQFYEFVTGNKSSGFTILEVSYSLGLLIGIVVFYNHLGKKKLSFEPTPIEVSMKSYEREMDEAIVKRCERKGEKIDVG
jgi:stage V sporulation protein AA